MAFEFSSNDQFLRKIERYLREAPQRIHVDFAKRAEIAIKDLLDEQFQKGIDPYGQPYIPPKDGHTPPMVRTRALWRGLRVRVTSTPDGIHIVVDGDQEYSKYLQEGTRHMLPRMIVPGRNMLAPRWRERLNREASETVRAWQTGL